MVSAEKLGIAFGWGVASAVAFPIGCIVAFLFPMKKKINAALLAFGIGALLFALAYELFIEPLCQKEKKLTLFMIAVGAVIGAGVFEFTNWILDNRGAFLRHFNQRKEYLRSLLKSMTKKEASLGEQYKAHVKNRYRSRRHKSFIGGRKSVAVNRKPGYGKPPPPLLASASAPVLKRRANDLKKPLLEDNSKSVITSNIHKDSTTNKEPTLTETVDYTTGAPGISVSQFDRPPKKKVDWKLDNDDEEEEDERIAEVEHIVINEGEDLSSHDHPNSIQLAKHLGANIEEKYVGLVIWLGLLIDSIPESIVIGLLTIKPGGMSYSFIFGVFLSNFPEALSSSVIMMDEGFSKKAVLGMWMAVMISTGLGAVIGAAAFTEDPDEGQDLASNTLKGMAGGAMLVMIARTGLPEAFHQAGNIVGFSTLFGFLAAFICAFTLDDL